MATGRAGGARSTGILSCFTDVSSGEEEDAPEPVEQDEETRELRIIDPNAYVSLFVKRESLSGRLTSQVKTISLDIYCVHVIHNNGAYLQFRIWTLIQTQIQVPIFTANCRNGIAIQVRTRVRLLQCK